MSEGHLWSPDKPLVELPGEGRVSERKVPTVYAHLVPFRGAATSLAFVFAYSHVTAFLCCYVALTAIIDRRTL